MSERERYTIVTGAAGFIGSCTLAALERVWGGRVAAVDDLGHGDKWLNVAKRGAVEWYRTSDADRVAEALIDRTDNIIHLGGISSTTEHDADALVETNTMLTARLARLASEHGVRMVYASSAATYGDGSMGFDDRCDAEYLNALRPRNAYGWSKAAADRLINADGPMKGVLGLKFFNVYGPNEYHKGGQQSVVPGFLEQLTTGRVKLFRSGRTDVADGMQSRDFVWVGDCVDVIMHAIGAGRGVDGLMNVGSGEAWTFKSMVAAVAEAAGIRDYEIEYIDMPADVARHYQYHTQADLGRLRDSGFARSMTTLESGVEEYVKKYLKSTDKYL